MTSVPHCNLRVRLVLLAAAAAMLPALLLGGVAYTLQRHSLERSYGSLLRLAAEQSAANVETWLTERLESATHLAHNPVVQEQCQALGGLAPESDEYFLRLFVLHDILNAARDTSEYEVRLWDARTGKVVYSTNSYAIGLPWCGLDDLARYDDHRWRRGVIIRTPLYPSLVPIPDSQGKLIMGAPTFQIAVAIGERADARMAVAVRPNLALVDRLLARDLGASSSLQVPLGVCVVTASGEFVTSPRPPMPVSAGPPWGETSPRHATLPASDLPTLPLAEYRQFARTGGAGAHLVAEAYGNPFGQTVHGAWAPISGTDWVVVAEIERAAMLAPLRQSLASIVAISVGVGLLVALAATMLFDRILRPLRHLTQATDQLADGNYTVRCGLHGRDEIGRLGQAFDLMAASVQSTLAQLESMRDQALSANRAKSAFLAHMSHELRTPLNAIVGYTDLLIERCKSEGQGGYLDALERIGTSAGYLTDVIGNVLDMSKIEAGKMTLGNETVVIRQVVDEVRHTVEPLAAVQRNRFDVQIDPACSTMRGDPIRLRQILINLLSNAFKFTCDGRVSLEVGNDAHGDRIWIVFRVVDSGIGMTVEQMAHLFEPFTQVTAPSARRYGGTGLGLFISKRFAEMMGGTLEARSAPGQGSTFTLRLPGASG